MTRLSTDSIESFAQKSAWIYRPLGFISLYAVWVASIRLLALTFITYFTISPTSHYQDISDVFTSNEVSLMGLSAFLFVGLMSWLYPLTSTHIQEIITREGIEKNFLPGFAQGAIFGGGIILAFVLGGTYRYLGSFIQFEEAPFELLNTVLRMVALSALVYCEEFIFHHRLQSRIQEHLPDWFGAILIALVYCGIKLIQFDLGFSHLLTLFLVSIALFYRSKNDGGFVRGAGYWAAILIVFNPLLSLPIFGNDFSGVLLAKYQNGTPLTRFLTGGVGGPISSFIFQLLLILDIGRSILKRRV